MKAVAKVTQQIAHMKSRAVAVDSAGPAPTAAIAHAAPGQAIATAAPLLIRRRTASEPAMSMDQVAVASNGSPPTRGDGGSEMNRRDCAEFSQPATVDSSVDLAASSTDNEHDANCAHDVDISANRADTPEREEDTVHEELEREHARDNTASNSLISDTPVVPVAQLDQETRRDDDSNHADTSVVSLFVPRLLKRSERKGDLRMPTGVEFDEVRQLYKNSKVRGHVGFHVFDVGVHAVFDTQLRLAQAFGMPVVRVEAYFGAPEAVQAWKEQAEVQFVHMRHVPRSWSNAELFEHLGVDPQRVLVHRWRERRVCRLAIDAAAWRTVQQRARGLVERARQAQESQRSNNDATLSGDGSRTPNLAGARLEVEEWRFSARTAQQAQERAANLAAKRAAARASAKKRAAPSARASRGPTTSVAPAGTATSITAAENGSGQPPAARARRQNRAGVQAGPNSTSTARPQSGPSRQGGQISSAVTRETGGPHRSEQQAAPTAQEAPIQRQAPRRQMRHNNVAPVQGAATGGQEAPQHEAAAPTASSGVTDTNSMAENRLQEALRDVERLANMVSTLQQQLAQMQALQQAAREQAALRASLVHQQQRQFVRQQSADSMSGMSWVPPMPPMHFGPYGFPYPPPHTYAPHAPYLSQHDAALVPHAAPAPAGTAYAQ